jgi:hypothetical protein
VGALLEKLGFRQLVEETLKVERQTRAMPPYQLILATRPGSTTGVSGQQGTAGSWSDHCSFPKPRAETPPMNEVIPFDVSCPRFVKINASSAAIYGCRRWSEKLRQALLGSAFFQ